MNKSKEHVHKYMRILVGGTKVIREHGIRKIIKKPGYEVFKCMIPGCPTYKPRELIIATQAICWKCNREFLLNMENTTLKKPMCRDCRRGSRENYEDVA